MISVAKRAFKKKTWREKINNGQKPKVVSVPKNWSRTMGKGKMLILTPELVNNYVKTIPKGKLTTINAIRDGFAKKFGADVTCPVSTGIFIGMCASAAEEDKAYGVRNIAPYWRVLKEDGKLNPKYPGGVRDQAAHLANEGFIIDKGKTEFSWVVRKYEDHLLEF